MFVIVSFCFCRVVVLLVFSSLLVVVCSFACLLGRSFVCVLFVVCGLLFVVCCVWFVVCGLLFVVC